MKLKITQEVARPEGHWQVMKWNLLKGESEDTAEVINKDNLITDFAISQLMTRFGGTLNQRIYLQFSDEIPTVELTSASSIADKVQGQFGEQYFFPTGATGYVVGKEVKGVFNADGTSGAGNIITMWLRLDVPLLIEEGDVLKVTYILSPTTLGNVITSGTIPYKTYAYGEDPEDPNAGTLVENIDFTATYVFTGEAITDPQYAPVKNPDGSMSYGTDLKFTYKSSVRALTWSTASPVSNAYCSVLVGGTNTRNLNINFPNTKPSQTPGSYYEVEVDFNVRVLPHV